MNKFASGLNRRTFLASSLAMGALSTHAAYSLTAEEFVLNKAFLPKNVRMRADLPAGEMHVDPNTFKLYFTLGNKRAIRYSVGVGRPGLYESGTFTVGAKREWPRWTPTPAMIKRDPGSYARHKDGMPGGPNNPLGARAMYLHDANGRDTMLRIHGTAQPWTIGSAVSNGCARLTNEHVVELYDQVMIGAKVVLYEVTGKQVVI